MVFVISIPARLFSLLITCLINKEIKNDLIFYTHFLSFSRLGGHCSVKHGDPIDLWRALGFGHVPRAYCKMRNYSSWHWGHRREQNSFTKQWEMISLCQKATELDIFLIVFKLGGKNVRQRKRNEVTKFFLMSIYECLSCL